MGWRSSWKDCEYNSWRLNVGGLSKRTMKRGQGPNYVNMRDESRAQEQ
jgi:hypothetical protein